MAGPYEEMQSPISLFDKPLPPAYSPRQEEDVGYHTWSWNLLSRPRNEKNSPKLKRSPTARDSATLWRSPRLSSAGNRTTLTGGKRKDDLSPPRRETDTTIQDKSPKPRSRFDDWSSPPRTAKTAPSQKRSPVHSPRSDADSWASPSLVPIRHVSQCDVRQRPVPVSPDGSFILPPRPRAMARIESNERMAPPKLKIRTQYNTPPPKITSDWDHGPRDGAVSRTGEQTLPRMRSDSDETVWPYVVPDITREEVEAAIFRGHAM